MEDPSSAAKPEVEPSPSELTVSTDEEAIPAESAASLRRGDTYLPIYLEEQLLQMDHTSIPSALRLDKASEKLFVELTDSHKQWKAVDLFKYFSEKIQSLLCSEKHQYDETQTNVISEGHSPPFSVSAGSFLQFTAYLSFMLDPSKFQKYSVDIVLCPSVKFCDSMCDLLCRTVIDYNHRFKQSGNSDVFSVLNISNVFTIFQNYIGYEFHLTSGGNSPKFSISIRQYPRMDEFIRSVLDLASFEIAPLSTSTRDDRHANELTSYFRRHIVEFLNTFLNCRLLSMESFPQIIEKLITWNSFPMFLRFLLEQVEQKDEESLYLLRIFAESPEFSKVLLAHSNLNHTEKDMSSLLLESFSTTFFQFCSEDLPINKRLFALELIDLFIEVCCSDVWPVSFFQRALFSSPLHLSNVMNAIEFLSRKGRNLFPKVEVENAIRDESDIASPAYFVAKTAVLIYQLYCTLFDSSGLFIKSIKSHFCVIHRHCILNIVILSIFLWQFIVLKPA